MAYINTFLSGRLCFMSSLSPIYDTVIILISAFARRWCRCSIFLLRQSARIAQKSIAWAASVIYFLFPSCIPSPDPVRTEAVLSVCSSLTFGVVKVSIQSIHESRNFANSFRDVKCIIFGLRVCTVLHLAWNRYRDNSPMLLIQGWLKRIVVPGAFQCGPGSAWQGPLGILMTIFQRLMMSWLRSSLERPQWSHSHRRREIGGGSCLGSGLQQRDSVSQLRIYWLNNTTVLLSSHDIIFTTMAQLWL